MALLFFEGGEVAVLQYVHTYLSTYISMACHSILKLGVTLSAVGLT
jgi:hypothetical protein